MIGETLKTGLFVAVFLLFIINGCEKEPEVLQGPVSEKTEEPDQEGWDSVVKASKSGRIEAVIKYGHMMRYEKQKRTLFDQNIHVDFYDRDGRVRSYLTAIGGELDERSNDVKAFGNVVVESDTGVTLITEELYFDQQSQKITSNVDVVIISVQGDTIYGTGLVSDPQLINYRLNKIRGVAHKGFDLSPEALDRRNASTADSMAVDTLQVGQDQL